MLNICAICITNTFYDRIIFNEQNICECHSICCTSNMCNYILDKRLNYNGMCGHTQQWTNVVSSVVLQFVMVIPSWTRHCCVMQDILIIVTATPGANQ